MMDKKNIYLLKSKIFRALLLIVAGILFFQGHPTAEVYAEDADITSLTAEYSGSAVMVGKEIDISKLKVSATYEDGVTDEVKGYTIVSKKVAEEGTNLLMVIYQGKTANFYVTGKKLLSLNAYYDGPLISLGNTIRKSDVKVLALFSDGTEEYLTDFKLQAKEISELGRNKLFVICENKTMEISVYGIKPGSISALYATYTGGTVTVGSSINRDNLTITAAYKDGTSEVINNYVLTPEVLSATGSQALVASYQGKSVTFTVTGVDKMLAGISVRYTGNPIGVGNLVKPIDVEVTGTYSDGTTGLIKEFNLLSASITYVGYQVVTVEVQGYKAEFIVEGVEVQIADYSNACEFEASNGSDTAKVAIAVPRNIDKNKISGKSINVTSVTKLLTRALRKSTALAFEIDAEEEIIDEFPFTVKITIPSDYKLSTTNLYFTPNRRTVIGKMAIDAQEPNIIEVTIFHPGTYILTNKGIAK